ncbi:MAG: S26 family signal peptidase [Victivallales bacterium]|nr:S26 family signal peptidase [Victivallales bacterium]
MDIICNGPSMKPTLMPGDKIETEEVIFDDLQRGDIIIYNSPESIRLNIIHRISGHDADGLITRGDNNVWTDPYRVRPEHHPLKVVAIQRGSRHIVIAKYSIILHLLRILQKKASFLKRKYLYPIYSAVADLIIFYPAACLFKTEVRKFKRPKGIEFQLFLGKRRIGVFQAFEKKWYIRFPWRMFVKAPEMDKE